MRRTHMLAIAAVLAMAADVPSGRVRAERGIAVAETGGERTMASEAKGPFEVKTTPQAATDGVGHASIGRLALDKVFHGDLEATSKGQMLGLGTEVKGSAGYVALEVVDGTLAGRKGTFALQHSGSMNRGAMTLQIAVVPDSGTGGLTGIEGRMAIDIAPGGAHTYTLTYTLPDPK